MAALKRCRSMYERASRVLYPSAPAVEGMSDAVHYRILHVMTAEPIEPANTICQSAAHPVEASAQPARNRREYCWPE